MTILICNFNLRFFFLFLEFGESKNVQSIHASKEKFTRKFAQISTLKMVTEAIEHSQEPDDSSLKFGYNCSALCEKVCRFAPMVFCR